MIQGLVRLSRTRLARNIFALYVVRAANQLLPLIVIPYLARVLGPSGWGLVAFAQAFAMYGIITVEYGFEFSGTRAVARDRGQASRMSELVAGILGLHRRVVPRVGAPASAVARRQRQQHPKRLAHPATLPV